MDRRHFLYASVAAGLTVGTRSLRSEVPAESSCSPPNMYGFQQCVAGIQTSKLGVTAYQRATEWCWAACISGVFAYYGHDISQPRIVEEAYGGIVNLPGSPQAILSSLNRKWTDDDGNEFAVETEDGFTSKVDAIRALSEDHPLIIGTLGHAMILTAMQYVIGPGGQGDVTAAIVRDPWPWNPRRRMLSPQEWYNIQFAARIRVS